MGLGWRSSGDEAERGNFEPRGEVDASQGAAWSCDVPGREQGMKAEAWDWSPPAGRRGDVGPCRSNRPRSSDLNGRSPQTQKR